PKSDWPGRRDVHIAPDTHLFIRRHGGPIDERDGQIVRLRRKYLYGKAIRFTRLSDSGYLKPEQTPSARDFFGRSDLYAVHPNIGTIVDSIKSEPYELSFIVSGDLKFRAIPPGVSKRACRWHHDIREVLEYWIGRARDGAQVHPAIGIGIDLVLHQRAENRGRNHGRIPAARSKSDCRNRGSLGVHLCRGLDKPALPQQHSALFRCGRDSTKKKDQTAKDNERPHHGTPPPEMKWSSVSLYCRGMTVSSLARNLVRITQVSGNAMN